jgi:hypothetical protein
MNRSRRPAKRRSPNRNGSRQVVGVVVMGVALALGVVATNEFITVQRKAAEAAAKAAAPSDDEIYTGSILYMPDTSNVCHQWLFDNRNGQLADNGTVDCQRAAYQSGFDQPKQWSAARVRVISTGFRGE